jgi:hypothetical protein
MMPGDVVVDVVVSMTTETTVFVDDVNEFVAVVEMTLTNVETEVAQAVVVIVGREVI